VLYCFLSMQRGSKRECCKLFQVVGDLY
jgi:hypothetical protein